MPSAAATERKPVMINSLPRITTTAHAGANGNPPVSNFGWNLPAVFWEVAEVQTAFANLSHFALTSNDWKVFGYLVGRGGLWLSVALALWSMFDYFRFFISENNRKRESLKDALIDKVIANNSKPAN